MYSRVSADHSHSPRNSACLGRHPCEQFPQFFLGFFLRHFLVAVSAGRFHEFFYNLLRAGSVAQVFPDHDFPSFREKLFVLRDGVCARRGIVVEKHCVRIFLERVIQAYVAVAAVTPLEQRLEFVLRFFLEVFFGNVDCVELSCDGSVFFVRGVRVEDEHARVRGEIGGMRVERELEVFGAVGNEANQRRHEKIALKEKEKALQPSLSYRDASLTSSDVTVFRPACLENCTAFCEILIPESSSISAKAAAASGETRSAPALRIIRSTGATGNIAI